MKKLALAVVLMLSATTAYASSDLCKTFNLSKDGKPLAGAALNSRMAKCDKIEATCNTTAVSKEGNKPLSGAAKTSYVKKCVTDAMAY